MAVFEKQFANKIHVDDTDEFKCVIENAHNVDGHTEYSIRVQRASGSDRWRVSRRFRDFANLNSSVQNANIQLPFPPKKIIGNMNPEFVAERRNALQVYLNAVMKNYILAYSLPTKLFLDPKNYSVAFEENALQNVSMALRGDGNFELKTPLHDIGWRIRKKYYLVTKISDTDENYLMSWQTYGPDRVIPERDMQAALKILMNMEHPHIDKIIFVHCLETGIYVVRKLQNKGSLKDHIYGTQYKNPFICKYANPKRRKPFTTGQIAHYGHQILQTLKFLHDKGFPYGHLQTANLFIENQRILLTDIENCILGVPMYLRPLIIKHRKIFSLEDIDIYNFGHILYEMAFGQELFETACESFPYHESEELISLMKMILSPNICKIGLPKIEMIMSHPFFNKIPSTYTNIYINCSKKVHLKFSHNTKVQLKQTIDQTELRIRNDKKLAHKEKKQIKIQEILSSAEGIDRRRIKKTKSKEDSLFRSTSLNGFPISAANGPSERSESAASTSSTTSSHTSPNINCANGEASTSLPPSSNLPPSNNNRSLLLNSISAFNKESLNRVKSS